MEYIVNPMGSKLSLSDHYQQRAAIGLGSTRVITRLHRDKSVGLMAEF